MKPLWILALLLGLTGCLANPSRADEASELRDDLSALDAVADVRLRYTEPITLDSGKVDLVVTMRPDASEDAVVEVVTTAYGAFADAHEHEEGDLEVRLADDAVHLRSFEPVAEAGDVTAAARDAVRVLGGSDARAEINTQDVAGQPHVETRFLVDVDEPGREALLREVDRLEQAYADVPHAEWRVQSGGEFGWLLEGSGAGFPDRGQRALFDDLSAALPSGAAILMYDTDFVVLQVAPDSEPAGVSRTVGRHLDLLGDEGVLYHVERGEEFSAMFGGEDCTFDTDPLGVRLERDFGDRCPKITHPSDWD